MAGIESAPRDLALVKQFSTRFPAWSQASLRNLILNARDRIDSRGRTIAGNGLEEAGAVIRLGRRVLIDVSRFFEWIAAQQCHYTRVDREQREREPKLSTRKRKTERRVSP